MSDEKLIAVPEGEYAAYLATMAARIADERIHRRDLFWRGILSLVIVALAAFGYGNVSSIRAELLETIPQQEDFKSDIEQEVKSSVGGYLKANLDEIVADRIASLQKNIEGQTVLLSFVILAGEIKDGTTFTRLERDTVIQLADQLQKHPVLLSTNQFRVALESLVDSFVQANLTADINGLDKSHSKIMEATPDIAANLLSFYAVKRIGSADGGEEFEDQFSRYCRSTESRDYGGMAIAYKMLLTFRDKNDGWGTTIGNIWNDVGYLEKREQKRFILVLQMHRSDDEPKLGESARVAELTVDFIKTYERNFASLIEDVNDEALRKLHKELQ